MARFARPVSLVLAIAWPLTATACSEDPVRCTGSFAYGISVQVQDSVSGAAAATGARLVLREGAYVEIADQPLGGVSLSGAGERPGVYSVTVEKAGYHDWTRTNVRVTADECHVQGVSLTARLQPM